MGSLPGQIANVITVAWQWLTQNGGGVVIVVGAVAAGVAWYSTGTTCEANGRASSTL